jgi:hypothetical protein
MDSATQSADALRKQITATEEELKRLKVQLASVEAHDGTNGVEKSLQGLEVDDASPVTHGKWPLSTEEYKRYGRQMIVPSIGIQGIPCSPFYFKYFADKVHRSTPTQSRQSPDRGSRRSRLSCRCVHSWCRCGDYRDHRWRCC